MLHPTSLPGPHGIGDLGPEAYRFIDDLHDAGQTWWQMLPVTPPGYGESPYASLSAFAGNPLLISLEKLAEEDLIEPGDIGRNPELPDAPIDFARVKTFKEPLLRTAFARARKSSRLLTELTKFRRANADWIESWSLFTALKAHHDGRAWTEWPEELRQGDERALKSARTDNEFEILYQIFLQFVFDGQWKALRRYAQKKNVKFMGDVPIFLAHDSADVWAHRNLFKLDPSGQPSVVAGVPPDYFSTNGQRWGNPLYDWKVHAKDGFSWWIRRLEKTFTHFDAVRLDHFIGFYRAWEIPSSEPTAINGKWAAGPRAPFFETIMKALKKPALIAEDLGNIIPPVVALRRKFNLPGMFVLHFAFGDGIEKTRKRLKKVTSRTVVYTGTHDNDTSLGWFRNHGGGTEHAYAEIKTALEILQCDGSQINWDLIRFAFSSEADLAIVPIQDYLGLDSSARMNRPGTNEGNWAWRFRPGQFSDEIKNKIHSVTETYDRLR